MKYNGIELKEFTSDKPIIFDRPKKMIVWNDVWCNKEDVVAYIPGRNSPAITVDTDYEHCAEIPEKQSSRRANNRELAKWLAQGNGECHLCNTNTADAYYIYRSGYEDCCASIAVKIRKWDDTEWHEPTVDYMFGEDAV